MFGRTMLIKRFAKTFQVAESSASPVGFKYHLATDVLTDETEARVAVFQRARTWAEVTNNSDILAVPPSSGLLRQRCFYAGW